MTTDALMSVAEVEEAVKHTEASMLKMLRAKHAASGGNGPEWAYLEHVRNAAGFKATRTLDAMALSLWPSRGHELHGYEVKVSRSDFRRELADGGKADTWHGIVDRFWIVAPAGIVPKDELPATWGLIESDKAGVKLRVVKQAPLQTAERSAITRDVLVPMLRAAGAALAVTPEKAAIDAAFARGLGEGRKQSVDDAAWLQSSLDKANKDREYLQGEIRQIRDILGVNIGMWAQDGPRAAKVRDALRSVLAEDDAVDRARRNVERAADDMERAAQHLQGQAEWLRKSGGRPL